MTTIPRPAVFVRLALLASALCGAHAALSADLAASAPAAAPAAPAAQYVRIHAAACTSCHGPSGRAPEGSTIPSLAGRPQAELLAQMQAFRSGARPATVMHQIAKGYTDEQLAAIAAWFVNVR
ncbi:c-type cytochrome [Cupriavidus consociatus]|uniref:c-type cytochrome n=1 Tax=Cupriavidus consociatus TaxID=2821357 RepID=UPI001AE30687|nr:MULTISPECIES: c-type cytochrome [unclassified Cupriavidus]MBP0622995.1 c-type cytochrome [Cupriavidus sp. LEh25]MDK2659683.1 c-type cytochrome [Cupriavidus sp. LEh21]